MTDITFVNNLDLTEYFSDIFRKEMPGYYKELITINKELINGYNIRLQNYNEGVETMKKINAIIQKASRLRGRY